MRPSALYPLRIRQSLRGHWDKLGPETLLLQCLHRDTPRLQERNTKKLYGTKNNCVHVQLVQILDKGYKETKKIHSCHFWRARSKNRVLGAKPECWTCLPLYSTPPKRWANPSSLTPHTCLPSPQIRNKLTPLNEPGSKWICYLFLLHLAGVGAPIKPCLEKKSFWMKMVLVEVLSSF